MNKIKIYFAFWLLFTTIILTTWNFLANLNYIYQNNDKESELLYYLDLSYCNNQKSEDFGSIKPGDLVSSCVRITNNSTWAINLKMQFVDWSVNAATPEFNGCRWIEEPKLWMAKYSYFDSSNWPQEISFSLPSHSSTEKNIYLNLSLNSEFIYNNYWCLVLIPNLTVNWTSSNFKIKTQRAITYKIDVKSINIMDNGHVTPSNTSAVFGWIEIRTSWSWNSIAEKYIIYGPTPDNLNTVLPLHWLNNDLWTNLVWLSQDTRYYYVIVWKDIFWNEDRSDILSFKTNPPPSIPSKGWDYYESCQNTWIRMDPIDKNESLFVSDWLDMAKTGGIFHRPVVMIDCSQQYRVDVDKGTLVTHDGKAFTGTIMAPDVIQNSLMPSPWPECKMLKAIRLGAEDWSKLNFSQNYSITFPLFLTWVPDFSKVKVYYVNDNNDYIIAWDWWKLVDNNKKIKVTVNHMTDFVVMYCWQEIIDEKALKAAASIPPQCRSIQWIDRVKVPYTDINNHWSKPYVEDLYSIEKVLINRNKYLPDDYLTRTEFLKIALEVFKYKVDLDASLIDYADTYSNEWYWKYLSTWVKEWIIDPPIQKIYTLHKVPDNLDIFNDYLNAKYALGIKSDISESKRIECINIQRILEKLGYNIQTTWIYDNQTVKALIEYQKDNKFKSTLGYLGNSSIRYLNTEKVNFGESWTYKSKFRPSDSIFRGETMKVMLEAMWVTPIGNLPSPFYDVPQDMWYTKYITYAVSKCIVNGYGNWDFGPGNPVLRWEISKIAINWYRTKLYWTACGCFEWDTKVQIEKLKEWLIIDYSKYYDFTWNMKK